MIDPSFDAAAVSLYCSGRSLSESARTLGVSANRVRKALVRSGISRRPQSTAGRKPIPCNDHAFDKISTEHQAYWLGFISADGCVYRGNTIEIEIARKDREHLVKFLEFINSSKRIPDRSVRYSYKKASGEIDCLPRLSSRASVTSKQMVSDLFRYGITERKSLVNVPWNGPEQLMRHYWRGVVDGDGSIANGTTKKDRTCDVSLAGSLAVCMAFKKFIAGNIGACGCIVRHGKLFMFRATGNKVAEKIVRLLYINAAVSLDRKQRIADSIIDRSMLICR